MAILDALNVKSQDRCTDRHNSRDKLSRLQLLFHIDTQLLDEFVMYDMTHFNRNVTDTASRHVRQSFNSDRVTDKILRE